MSAWVLPDQIADVLPSEARHIEELRRALLDAARGYGYELVIPPLIEHLESLLTGTGQALDLQTFKLVDQLSGRSLGLRADSTPQVARIDAHLLNRAGVTRLCYCGPVLHARVDRPHGTREPLQFGAEIYGHAGGEADLEVVELALASLRAAGLSELLVDMADVRVVDSLLADAGLAPDRVSAIHAALAAKDSALLRELGAGLPDDIGRSLLALPGLCGEVSVLDEAARVLRPSPALSQALDSLRQLARQLQAAGSAAAPAPRLSVDLADLRGYSYYTGLRFSVFARGTAAPANGGHSRMVELVRGGRYDEVGRVFGRSRPAVGFSLDLKDLVAQLAPPARQAAIRAPWGETPALREAIAQLRAAGHTVVCALPGHGHELDEFDCDRQLVARDGRWTVEAVATAAARP